VADGKNERCTEVKRYIGTGVERSNGCRKRDEGKETRLIKEYMTKESE